MPVSSQDVLLVFSGTRVLSPRLLWGPCGQGMHVSALIFCATPHLVLHPLTLPNMVVTEGFQIPPLDTLMT